MTDDPKGSCLVLLSGGMDSCVLAAWALRRHSRVLGLAVDYGQRHARQELRAAEDVAKALGIGLRMISGPMLFHGSPLLGTGLIPPAGHPDAACVVPGRNAVLLALAASWCESEGIETAYLGATADDQTDYVDCRPVFLGAFSSMVQIGGFPAFMAMAPFAERTKGEVVALGRELGAPLESTWSCYDPDYGDRHSVPQPCGRCAACARRQAALKA